MTSVLIKSNNIFKGKIAQQLMLLCLSIGANIFFVGGQWNKPNWWFYTALGVFFITVVTLYVFIKLAGYHSLTISAGKLVAKSVLGYTAQTIYLKDITGWFELPYKTKQQNYYELTICTETGKYTISSLNYSNYSDLKSVLTNGIPVDSQRLKQVLRLDDFKALLGFVALGLICLTIVIKAIVPDKPAKLVTIKTVITKQPQIVLIGTRNSYHTLWFYLNEYPDLDFCMSYKGFDNMDLAAFSDGSKCNLPLRLQITESDYEVKLAHLRQPGFWERNTNDNFVEVYGYSDDKYVYLKPESYGANNENRYLIITVFMFACLFCFGIVFKRLFNKEVNTTVRQLE